MSVAQFVKENHLEAPLQAFKTEWEEFEIYLNEQHENITYEILLKEALRYGTEYVRMINSNERRKRGWK